MMKTNRTILATLALALPLAFTTPALADTGTTTSTSGVTGASTSTPTSITTSGTTPTTVTGVFAGKYQQNLQAITTLLTQAQAGLGTNSQASALVSAAVGINQQASTLFAAEQSLAASRSSVVALSGKKVATLKQLQDNKADLLTKLNVEMKNLDVLTKKVKHKNKKQDKTELHKSNVLQKTIALQMAQLTKLNAQIVTTQKSMNGSNDYAVHPYDGGLPALQDSILRLQAASLHYVREATVIEASATTSSSASTSTGTSSSTSVSGTITTGGSTSTTGTSTTSTSTGTP